MPHIHHIRLRALLSRALLGAAAGLLWLAPGALGATQFGAPFDVSAAGQDAGAVQTAVDPAGDTAYAWIRILPGPATAVTRTRRADGSLSPLQELSVPDTDHTVEQVHVTLAANGTATFIWRRRTSGGPSADAIQTRTRDASGILSPIVDLSAPGDDASTPRVAALPGGSTLFVWSRGSATDASVQAREQSAAGTLGPIQDITAPGGITRVPELGVDGTGRALIAWTRSTSPNDGHSVELRAREPNGSLGPVESVADPGLQARISVDQSGAAAIAWERIDNLLTVAGRTRSATGSYGTAWDLSPAVEAIAQEQQVGVDRNGQAVAAWTFRDNSGLAVQTRRFGASSLGAVKNVADPGRVYVAPALAVDRDGNATFAWFSEDVDHVFRIEARSEDTAEAMDSGRVLADSTVAVLEPQLSLRPNGDGAAAWGWWDGANLVVQSSLLTAPPVLPQPPTTPPPAAKPPAAGDAPWWTTHPDVIPATRETEGAAPLSKVRMTHTRFRVRRKHRRRGGTAFTYETHGAAEVRIRIARRARGRRAHKKCRRPSRRTRSRAACVRYERMAELILLHKKSGSHRVSWSGRAGSTPLPPGRYRASIRGLNYKTGAVSPWRKLGFRVVGHSGRRPLSSTPSPAICVPKAVGCRWLKR